MSFEETCYAQVHLYLVKSRAGARMLWRVYWKPLNFEEEIKLIVSSRILKNNIHPEKASLFCFCFFVFFFVFVVVLFLFLFFCFFHQISRSLNDETSIICLLISVTATFSLKILVERRRSSFDLTTSLRLTF